MTQNEDIMKPITTNQLNQGMGNEGSGVFHVHEIFTKINNAKDKPAKIAILKQYDNQAMRMLLRQHLIQRSKFDSLAAILRLSETEATFIGTEHTSLRMQKQENYFTL